MTFALPTPDQPLVPAPRPRLTASAVALLGLVACGDNLSHPVGPSPYEPAPPVELTCVPDLDGQITAAELAPAIGVPVSYFVSPPSPPSEARAFDPLGLVDASGRRVWDLTLPDSDPVVSIAARPIASAWYAASFPADAFVVPLDAAQTLDGVYLHDAGTLTLLGLASALADPAEGRTLWRYEAPVVLYRFPLSDGARWTSIGEVRDGLVRGLPYAGRDTYEMEVAGAGQLALPDMTFSQVLRVRSRLVSEPAVGQAQTRNQISWLFECFGEVARATSQTGERESDFTRAAEIRRLGL